jgi:hypothetical protein
MLRVLGLYLSSETINRPPQSRETIPLMSGSGQTKIGQYNITGEQETQCKDLKLCLVLSLFFFFLIFSHDAT